jgi:hypothetical protein
MVLEQQSDEKRQIRKDTEVYLKKLSLNLPAGTNGKPERFNQDIYLEVCYRPAA